jgi:hypothetical protein
MKMKVYRRDEDNEIKEKSRKRKLGGGSTFTNPMQNMQNQQVQQNQRFGMPQQTQNNMPMQNQNPSNFQSGRNLNNPNQNNLQQPQNAFKKGGKANRKCRLTGSSVISALMKPGLSNGKAKMRPKSGNR